MYYAACIGTGLTVACLLWLALVDTTPLRLVIFGVLAAGVALGGITMCDRIRNNYQ